MIVDDESKRLWEDFRRAELRTKWNRSTVEYYPSFPYIPRCRCKILPIISTEEEHKNMLNKFKINWRLLFGLKIIIPPKIWPIS